MGVRFPGAGNITLVNTVVVTTAETVVLTSSPLNLALDFEQVLILWMLEFTMGTGGTLYQVRIRRGAALTSTLISTVLGEQVTAANSYLRSGCYVDTPGAIAGQQYSITFAQLAATANASIADGCIAVIAL